MASITEIRSIVELYVGWFNRIPETEGFDFWVGRLDQGSSLAAISNEFFESAVHQFSAETGYRANMTDAEFITQLYDGVMGRTGDLAPDETEIGYWAGKLNGEFAGDKGAMVVQMIEEIKAFDATGNDAIKAVQDKFNNKVQLALEIVALPDAPGFTGTIEEGKALLNTITEDDATVQAALNSYLDDINAPTFNLTPNVESIAEGDLNNFGNTAEFTLNTTNVADGTEVAYTISGVDGADLANGESALTGTVIVENGTATISVALTKDNVIEGTETLTVSIDGQSVTANMLVTDAMTSVNGNAELATAGFSDIKTANDKIEIRDVSNNITINYDANTLQANDDNVRIEVGEVPTTQFAPVSLDLTEGDAKDAAIESVTLTSSRNESGANEVTVNTLSSLSVGDALATLNIDGAATDTTIEAALDRMVTTVDANALEGNLTLDLTAALKDVTYIGAQGNDTVTFDTPAEDENGVDVVTAVDVDGDGEVDFNSVQNNHNISGNAGDDTFNFAEDGLTIGDTISGGEGNDTIVITERDDIQRSETVNVSGVETIDLHEAGSLLVVTDNLVTGGKEELAKNFTVDTTHQTEDSGTSLAELDISTPQQLLDNPDSVDDGHVIDITEVTVIGTTDAEGNKVGFTYDGGKANDALLISDAQLNSEAHLSFGEGSQDQMRIVNGATVTADDFNNISGLEAIVLVVDSTQPQTWSIELDDSVFADDKNPNLKIYVDPTVPQGSVLNLSGTGLSKLQVFSNSNVTVNGVDKNSNIQQLEFTENADDLVGTAGNDVFHATSLDQITVADVANAGAHTNFDWPDNTLTAAGDSLQLDFAVANGGFDIIDQLLKPNLSNFETLVFNTDKKVAITTDIDDTDGDEGFLKYYLGTNNDVVNVAQQVGTVAVYLGDGKSVTSTDAASNGDELNIRSEELDAEDRLDGDLGTNETDENDWLNVNASTKKAIDEQFKYVDNFETLNLGTGNNSQVKQAITSGDDVLAGGALFEATKLGQTQDDLTGLIAGHDGNDQIAFTSELALTLHDAAFDQIVNTDFGTQGGVSQQSHLNIDAGAGNDIVAGGAGNDTITDGTGADTIMGSTGADTINLSVDTTTDYVTFTRAEDGAKTGQGEGFDIVKGFAVDTDKVAIEGTLLKAITGSAGTDITVDATNDAALDINTTQLATYINNSLVDAELTDLSNQGELLTYLNNNLDTAGAGESVIFSVQGTENTGLYFYQENAGDNIVDQSEIRMLSLFEDALLDVNDFEAAFVKSNPDFSIANVTVDEGAGTATVTITRDDPVAAATIDVATADGTATAGTDYTALTETVNFAAGAATATATIAITDDADSENDETFSVSLSNPSIGQIVAGQGTATVTITDNDANLVLIPVGADLIADTLTANNAEDETFVFDAEASLGNQAPDAVTQVTLDGFAIGNDVLRINTATEIAATTLNELNGVDGIAVQANPITNSILVNFGPDANGNEVVTLTLAGLTDPTAIGIEVV